MKRYKVAYLDSNKNIIKNSQIMREDECDLEAMMFNMLSKYRKIRNGLTAVKIEVGDW